MTPGFRLYPYTCTDCKGEFATPSETSARMRKRCSTCAKKREREMIAARLAKRAGGAV